MKTVTLLSWCIFLLLFTGYLLLVGHMNKYEKCLDKIANKVCIEHNYSYGESNSEIFFTSYSIRCYNDERELTPDREYSFKAEEMKSC